MNKAIPEVEIRKHDKSFKRKNKPRKNKDLIEATPEQVARRLKRSIERDKERFAKLLEEHAPPVDKSAVFNDFTTRSHKNSTKLVNLATQMLSFINAVHYANQALIQTLNADDTAYDIGDISRQITKISRIKMLKLLCREFKVDRNYEKQIISNLIDATFLTPVKGNSIGSQSNANTQNASPKTNQNNQGSEGSFTRKR